MGTLMLCSEASLVNHGLARFRAATLRCRCWSCGMCLPIRIARLVKDVADGLPQRFLTLTTAAVEGADPVTEARRQTEAFAILIKRIRHRCAGQEVAFFVVREATQRGWPHLHVALRSPYLPQAWLSAQWKALTGSPGVDIRKIYSTANAAKYLAKYLGKSPHRFGTTKRYWSSRNWRDVIQGLEVQPTDWSSQWFIVRENIGKIAENYFLRGWKVEMRGRFGYFEARAPP